MTITTLPLHGRPSAAEPKPVPPVLDRRFEAVVFDWDGTAVPDRGSDASQVRAVIEDLCAAGMDVAVVTGTHIGNVDGQLRARPIGPGRLYLCLNRGSEVYAVGEEGPNLIVRRVATEAEEAALDAAAAETVTRLAAGGVRAEIVSQRLNRRKIDVIPEPEWADPPKAQISELLAAVEGRLRSAGLDGLREAVLVAEEAARNAGLSEPEGHERCEARRDRTDRQGRFGALDLCRALAPRDRRVAGAGRRRRVRPARRATRQRLFAAPS